MNKLETYIVENTFTRPTVVIDIDQVKENYQQFARGLQSAHIHYAVKANPHPEVLKALSSMGCRFDAASQAEIEYCLDAGAVPEHISFGNTVKRPQDIAWAYSKGIICSGTAPASKQYSISA